MDIFHPHLLDFRPKMRTSNNIFILKTLIEKQFMSNNKLYCSFVDFSKAFDTVWRKGLITKIESYGVQGKMLNVIKSLYNDTTAQVKVSDQLSSPFEISLGVKQGDPPSPFFFNTYMNDLCTNIMENEKDTDSPNIKDIKVPCLFWADDLILISKSKEGLQEHLNILADYCEEWKLSVNIDKTEIIIFNKGGRLLKKEVFSCKDKVIEIVKQHRYLGILLDATGKLNTAMTDLDKKAMRATHTIYKLSTYNQISPRLLLQTYNSMIEPILLFSSETWAPEMKPNNDTENSFLKFCKHTSESVGKQ